MKKLLLLLIIISFSKSLSASHVLGGEITYYNIGGNQYNVQLYLYWDCIAGFNPGNSQQIEVNGCTGNFFATLNQSSNTPGDGLLATSICSSQISGCNGGNIPGLNVIEYEGIVTLPGNCANWVFSWETCCRTGTLINMVNPDLSGIYIYSTLNNSIASYNNSIKFSNFQLVLAAVNQATIFNLGAYDLDGNNLTYSFVSAKENSTTNLNYNPPYSASSPIIGATLDSTSGDISINPSITGLFEFCVLIKERNQNGNIIGEVLKDFVVLVNNYANTSLPANIGNLSQSSLNGDAVLINPHEIFVCPGSNLSFTIDITDPDLNDSVFVFSNIGSSSNFSNAMLTSSYPVPNQENTIRCNFSWTIPNNLINQNLNLILTVRDNACPFIGVRNINYIIRTGLNISAGADIGICQGSNTTLAPDIIGGGIYSWYDINNNLIPVSSAFSCNPCINPIVQPTSNTDYILKISGIGACDSIDTVRVNVGNNFNINFPNSDTISGCSDVGIQLQANTSIGGSYNYDWSPTVFLNQSNISNPILTTSLVDTLTYTVNITNIDGCSKNKNLTVISFQNPPDFNLGSNYCLTSVPIDSIQLGPNIACGFGNNCDTITDNGCNFNGTIIQVGTDNLNTFPNPTPFMGLWEDAKAQYLFRSNELINQGIQNGVIYSIAFNITNVTSTLPYNDFTIRLKCTSTNQLAIGPFETGAITVYHNSAFVPINGWNSFTFNSPYIYDGQSSLIIEICYDNNDWSGDDNVEYSITPFPSSITLDQDGIIGCNAVNSEDVHNRRPNIKFGYSANINPSNFIINWSPTTGISNPHILNPNILPQLGTSTYTLSISSLNGLCTRTDTISFSIDPNNPQILNQPIDDTICIGQSTMLTTSVNGSVTSYQWFKDGLQLSDNSHYNGVNTNSLSVLNVTNAEGGLYHCEIIGSCSPGYFTNNANIIIENCTSLSNEKETNKINLYPNPTQGTLHLSIQESSYDEITILNTLGIRILKKQIQTSEKNFYFDLSALNNGYYTLILKGKNGCIAKSFIKE